MKTFDFKSYIKNYRTNGQKDASVEGYWYVLKWSQSFARSYRPELCMEHGGGMMNLVIVLVRSRNYGSSGYREIQVRKSILKQSKKLAWLFTKPHIKQIGNYLEKLCGAWKEMWCVSDYKEYGQN